MSQEDNRQSAIYNGNNKLEKKMKDNIISFLRELADKLEKDNLTPEAEKQTSEFFMKFKFFESLINIENTNDNGEEMIKFLSLGWYVYKHILPDEIVQ